MKKLLTLTFILFGFLANAQDRDRRISLNYGTGNGRLITFFQMMGASTKDGTSLTNVGLNYSYGLKKKNWHLETGLNYVRYKYTSTPAYHPQIPQITTNQTSTLISLPIKLKYEAGKYIFFNGNLYLDLDVSKRPSQELNGAGLGLGMGGQYFFNDKIGIYINPQLDLRSIVDLSPYKLLSTSLIFGLAYKLK